MDQPSSQNALWHFALSYYRAPGVAKALLALQDENNLKVNMLIFSVWLATMHSKLAICPSLGESEAWHANFSEPIRQKRKVMKTEIAQLAVARSELVDTLNESYQALLSAELAAEKVELSLLYQYRESCLQVEFESQPDLMTLVGQNIDIYCRYETSQKLVVSANLTDNLAELTVRTCNFINCLNIKVEK